MFRGYIPHRLHDKTISSYRGTLYLFKYRGMITLTAIIPRISKSKIYLTLKTLRLHPSLILNCILTSTREDISYYANIYMLPQLYIFLQLRLVPPLVNIHQSEHTNILIYNINFISITYLIPRKHSKENQQTVIT